MVATTPFVLPDIPALLTTQAQRREYLIDHYWDRFDFADTTYTPTPDITEQAWVDYIGYLRTAPLSQAQSAIRAMITKTERNPKLFQYFTEMAAKYLHEPNSPTRNEEIYIPVLEAMIQSPLLTETEKMLPRHRLQSAFRNRAGTPALDFRYTTRDGKASNLYRLRAEYLLVFFNEPGCPSCKDHIESIRRSPVLTQYQMEERLLILSIYADNDRDEWLKYYDRYPHGWINGYDPAQRIEKAYDLRAIPTLYLLDQNKKVLLKDATFAEIEQYLGQAYRPI
jgi:thiol-disulfide isomerase/thioredoxin